jgi:hypothetical protein
MEHRIMTTTRTNPTPVSSADVDTLADVHAAAAALIELQGATCANDDSSARDAAISAACHLYNSATCPWIHRTEADHEVCRRYASSARSALDALDAVSGLHYRETEDGALVSLV